MFTEEWSKSFVLAWNRFDGRTELAGLGRVRFVIKDEGWKRTFAWNAQGQVAIAPDDTPADFIVSASLAVFQAFRDGGNAGKLVVNGDMGVTGNFERLLHFVPCFANIAAVARALDDGCDVC